MSSSFSIIGHRGAKGLAPENSLESIKKALESGVDAIELDLHLLGEKVVLSHDKPSENTEYCLLEDALKTINGSVTLNLEIKDESVVKHLPKIMAIYQGNVVYSSFSMKALLSVRDRLPSAEIAVLEKWSGVRATHHARRLKTSRIHMNHRWLWSGFVASMNRSGYVLYAYTVNDKKRARKLQSWGVPGIFTDYPDRYVS